MFQKLVIFSFLCLFCLGLYGSAFAYEQTPVGKIIEHVNETNLPFHITNFLVVVPIIILLNIAMFLLSLGSKKKAVYLAVFVAAFSFILIKSILVSLIWFVVAAGTGFVVYYILSRAKFTENWRKWRKNHPEKDDDSGGWFSGGGGGGGSFGGFGGGSSGGGGASGRW